MSYSEEKKMILKMLEDGKINSEEAVKLLNALDNKNTYDEKRSNYRKDYKNKNFQDEIYKMRDRLNEWKREFKSNYNHKDFEKVIDDFSLKAEKVGKNLASTTFNIVDQVIDYVGSLVKTNSFSVFGTYKSVEQEFELPSMENLDLTVNGINGFINVKRSYDDKIHIKSIIRSPDQSDTKYIYLEETGSCIILKINNSENVNLSISHDIMLPKNKFKYLNFLTTNAKISLEDTISEALNCVTKNANIELMGVESDKISLKTKNAKIYSTYVSGKNIIINTSNSLIEVKYIKTESLYATTMNGRIYIDNAQNIDDSNKINMDVQTKNGSIKINMNDTENRGYKINAKTTLNGINLLIPNIKYNKPQTAGSNNIEAVTENYGLSKQQVNIKAETSNGYIEIVK